METKTTEIPLNKAKLRQNLVFSLIFIGFAARIMFFPKPGSFSGHHPGISITVGILTALFFLLAIAFNLQKLMQSSKALVISEDGILDNTTLISAGFIPWADIEDIRNKKIMGQSFIKVILKNPRQYEDKQTGIKRGLFRFNYKSTGAVSIPVSFLKSNASDVEAIINQQFTHVGVKN